MLLVDTSAWTLAIRRDVVAAQPGVLYLEQASIGKQIVVPTGLVLQELLQGFSGPKARLTCFRWRAAVQILHRRCRTCVLDACHDTVAARRQHGQDFFSNPRPAEEDVSPGRASWHGEVHLVGEAFSAGCQDRSLAHGAVVPLPIESVVAPVGPQWASGWRMGGHRRGPEGARSPR